MWNGLLLNNHSNAIYFEVAPRWEMRPRVGAHSPLLRPVLSSLWNQQGLRWASRGSESLGSHGMLSQETESLFSWKDRCVMPCYIYNDPQGIFFLKMGNRKCSSFAILCKNWDISSTFLRHVLTLTNTAVNFSEYLTLGKGSLSWWVKKDVGIYLTCCSNNREMPSSCRPPSRLTSFLFKLH